MYIIRCSIYDHTVQSGTSVLLQRMYACIEDVAIWMSTNRLCLNPSKTELIWLGSARRLKLCNLDDEMVLSGTTVRPVDCVRDLGVLVDSGITLANHVNKVAGLCYFHLRQLRIIRRALTNDTAHSWSERSSTIGSITATGYWLHHRNISLPDYSPSFVLRRG